MLATHASKSVLRLFNVSETCRECFRGGDECTTPIRAGDLVLSELVRLDESGATLHRFSHLETCIGKSLHRTLPSDTSALATLHPLDYEWYCDRIMRDRTAIAESAFLVPDKDARAHKLAAMDFEAIRRAQAEYDARVVSEAEAEAARAELQAAAAEAENKQREAATGAVDQRALWSKAMELHQKVTGPKLLKSHPVFGWDVVGPEVLKLRAKQKAEAEKAAAKKAAAEAEVWGEGAAAVAGSSAAAKGSAAVATGDSNAADASKSGQENEGEREAGGALGLHETGSGQQEAKDK